MRWAFCGTPHFAASILQGLLKKGRVPCAIVSQPDRPQGRSLQLVSTEVKKICPPEIPLFQPEKATDPAFLDALRVLDLDLLFVCAYGKILRPVLLNMPRKGCLNIHPSLLPLYRGATPMQSALLDGCKKTGVCLMRLEEGLDCGPIYIKKEFEISSDITLGELEPLLAAIGVDLFVEALDTFDTLHPHPQDHTKATFCHKILPKDLLLDLTQPPQEVHNKVRAFSPKPGAFCHVEIKGKVQRLKVLKTSLQPHIEAFCFQSIYFLEVQPEGKKPMSGAAFSRGYEARFC